MIAALRTIGYAKYFSPSIISRMMSSGAGSGAGKVLYIYYIHEITAGYNYIFIKSSNYKKGYIMYPYLNVSKNGENWTLKFSASGSR